MDVIWKAMLGALVTGTIAWLAKRGNTLPGILPLFPAFAVIALAIVGAKGSAAGFRETCLAGIKTLPAYLGFLSVAGLSVGYLDYRIAIGLGLAAWLAILLATFWLASLA